MDAYDFRAAATGGVACNFDYLSPDFDVEQCSKTINEQQRYKKYWEGDFYPLTAPSLDETVWSAYQLALADSGVCYFFRRAGSEEAEKTFALSAVEPDREYSVQLTDESGRTHTCTYSGRQLAEGVTIRIPAPRNSLIFHYTAI